MHWRKNGLIVRCLPPRVLWQRTNEQRQKGVKREIGRLEPHYKASEIWVGKDAEVGAQMTVPRVRGDKVKTHVPAHNTLGTQEVYGWKNNEMLSTLKCSWSVLACLCLSFFALMRVRQGAVGGLWEHRRIQDGLHPGEPTKQRTNATTNTIEIIEQNKSIDHVHVTCEPFLASNLRLLSGHD